MYWIDFPPAWTAYGVLAAWGLSRVEPGWLGFGPYHVALGAVVIATGLGLMLWASVTMLRHRTQLMPRRDAAALVTTGPFRISRNPIYLGDLLLLAGGAMIFDAPLALVLVPVLAAILQSRFIEPEEAMLRRTFGADFESWATRTRRWL
ncbi:MAG: protein-S-isoprenylcysteine O-methyltransferase Ste14 [Limimaricola cinnabarinus]|mgnify:CR=1 FL=1|jgi:protein-S-isoprenylcysteine O-methyltransferase Ste14|uniref:methyltransferase family protein n=1 Tax=Limimaricola cinnabarinus TaxID=1125964 RepID=UPI0039E2EE0C